MWFGEQITKRGIGNGISLLIFASIIDRAPLAIRAWIDGGPTTKLFFPLLAIGVSSRSSSSRKGSGASRSSTRNARSAGG